MFAVRFGGVGGFIGPEIAVCKCRNHRRNRPKQAAFPGLTLRQETPMVDLTLIEEHLEVVGSDGGHVGRVDHVLGDQIALARLDLAGGFEHHLIPTSWVEHVDDDKVRLTLTRDQAKAQWTEKQSH
jgi:hypothetical protein